MTDADFSARIVELLQGEGHRKLLSSAMQAARLALTKCGFEFHTPAKPSCSAVQDWLLDLVPTGSRLRLSVQMFDPARSCVMEIRAYLFVPTAESLRGGINSWLDAVTLAVPCPDDAGSLDVGPLSKGSFLVRKSLFHSPRAGRSLSDEQLDAWLSSRLSGKWPSGEEPDFEGQCSHFAAEVDAALSP